MAEISYLDRNELQEQLAAALKTAALLPEITADQDVVFRPLRDRNLQLTISKASTRGEPLLLPRAG